MALTPHAVSTLYQATNWEKHICLIEVILDGVKMVYLVYECTVMIMAGLDELSTVGAYWQKVDVVSDFVWPMFY